MTWIGLLRAVNVGGRRSLAMADLRRLVGCAGGSNVRTYIQSGNVLFDAPDGHAVARATEAAIAATCGFTSPVIVRTADDLRGALARSPFPDADPATLHLGCLSAAPDPARVAALDPERSPPDRYEVVGADLHLCLPAGAGRSKVTTAWIESQLGVTCTVRNWRTVGALVALAA